jgi:septal ring factor EnvC (AmiA/AmiB activator)
MATTQDKITALEEDIKDLKAERKAAKSEERRDKLLDAINHLYTQLEREQQQQQQQQQGMSLILFMIFIRNLPPVLTIV